MLIRKRQDYAVKIEDLILKPTLNDIFEATDDENLSDSAEHYRRAGEYLDGLRIEHELMGLFSDYDTNYDSDFSSFWFSEGERSSRKPNESSNMPHRPGRRLARLIRRLGWRRRIVETPFSWLRTDPSGLEMLKAHDDEISGYERQRKDIDSRIIEVDQQRNASETSLQATKRELKEYETRLWTAEAECARKLADCNLEAVRQQNLFTAAYLTGKTVYNYLGMKPQSQLNLNLNYGEFK